MANEVLIGRRSNGEYGIWVARPGWDANTAPESQLLISSAVGNFQFLMRGVVWVGYGATATVFYPEAMAQPPGVMFTAMISSGAYTRPQLCWDSNSVTLGDRIRAYTYTDRVVFYNRSVLPSAIQNALYVRYFILGKAGV